MTSPLSIIHEEQKFRGHEQDSVAQLQNSVQHGQSLRITVNSDMICGEPVPC